MAEAKKADAGQQEVQDHMADAMKKGFIGEVPPGPPNSAFSQESGPDSPSALEQTAAIHAHRIQNMKDSTADGKGF